MSTPKGMKCVTRTVTTGDKLLIYSNAEQIILQIRRQVASEENLLAASFKVAVPLSLSDAIWVVSELLAAALPHLSPSHETSSLVALEQQGTEST